MWSSSTVTTTRSGFLAATSLDSGTKTVSYEWNERFIPLLEDRGFDIISIPGSQLAIGGGAPLPDLSNPQGLKKDSREAVFLSSFLSLRKGSMILRPAFSTRCMYFFASNFFW